jgi:hypothetical protein
MDPRPIRVSEKALGHLSRGLYRSPASALRELISNAFDAGATKVLIGTTPPSFTRITVEDNGVGFTKTEFERLMEGGIGNSQKRDSGSYHTLNGVRRPVIGRLGIGMLGIAQICEAFTVVSQRGDGSRFAARITITERLRARLDANDPDVVKKRRKRTEGVVVGNWQFLPLPQERPGPGTIIVADSLHVAFSESFRSTLVPPDVIAQGRELTLDRLKAYLPPKTWPEFLSAVSKAPSLVSKGNYWALLWELGAACPIPYIDEHALPQGVIKSEHSRLSSYNFSVTVDGREIRKPVRLGGTSIEFTTRRIPRVRKKVYNGMLSFRGYLIAQEGLQLRPAELRGLLVRIKGVAVGLYDPSFLDFQINQGPRSRWVTGEIFVAEGLEDALNVDRDSFNQFHPQYKELQQIVHGHLAELFKTMYGKIKERSEEREKARTIERRRDFERTLAKASGKSIVVSMGTLPATRVQVSSGKVSIQLAKPQGLRTKRAYQELASAILALFDVVMEESSRDDVRRELFTDYLLKVLAKW